MSLPLLYEKSLDIKHVYTMIVMIITKIYDFDAAAVVTVEKVIIEVIFVI